VAAEPLAWYYDRGRVCASEKENDDVARMKAVDKVTIYLGSGRLTRLDGARARRRRSRSGVICEAVDAWLAAEERPGRRERGAA
jgi:hypothetical protein